MSEEEFWALVQATRATSDGNLGFQIDRLREALVTASDQSVVDFSVHLQRLVRQAYSRKLWLAFDFFLGQHGSDDTFEYCIGGLIALGRDVYERITKNPDSLAELPSLEPAELLLGLPYVCWNKRHPNSMLPIKVQPLILMDEPRTAEEANSLNEHLELAYPKLFARFGLPAQFPEFDPLSDPYSE